MHKHPGARRGALAVIPRASAGKKGAPCKLDDERFRAALVYSAAQGMSRRGTAASAGLSVTTLKNWLARGRAHPDIEPYGSFAVEYLRAERILEGVCASAMTREAQRIQAKAAAGFELRDSERTWLNSTQAQRYPKEWGISANSGRVVDDEPDADGYLQETQLTDHQLDTMLQEPPEEIINALHRNAESIVRQLVERGWRPPVDLWEDLGKPVDEQFADAITGLCSD